MLLFETVTRIGDQTTGADTTVTVDLDKVLAIINGGAGLTGLMFDGGVTLTIQTEYIDLIKYLCDNDESPDK